MENAKAKSIPHTSYMPQLDGLRAVAIMCVLIEHFELSVRYINNVVSIGRLGVILFFVLSGFLITRILLEEREIHESKHISQVALIRSFYIRRFLRIFPIYYLTIFLLASFDYAPIKDHLLWHLTYLSNFSFSFFGGTPYSFSQHFWSLCVEEQFYLFWPFVIVYAPRRYLHRVIMGVIIASVTYKALGLIFGLTDLQVERPVFGCMDSLGFGALLALYGKETDKYNSYKSTLIKTSIWIGLPLLIGTQILYALGEHGYKSITFSTTFTTLKDFAAALFFVRIVEHASQNSGNAFGSLLSIRPIRYVGKISYGIYIYHYFLKGIFPSFLYAVGITQLPKWGGFTILTLTSISLASVSWHFIEKPINNMKKYVPYTRINRELDRTSNFRTQGVFQLFKITASIGVISILVASSIYLFPYGLTSAANEFLATARNGKDNSELQYLVKDRASYKISHDNNHQLTNNTISDITAYKSATWGKRKLEFALGGFPLAILDGRLTTMSGKQKKIRFFFTKTKGEWDVDEVQIANKNSDKNRHDSSMPKPSQQVALVKNTFKEYALSISSKDFNRFYHFHSVFSRVMMKEAIANSYRHFISDKITFLPLLNDEPVVTTASLNNKTKILTLTGYYQGTKKKLFFIQKYIFEGFGWGFVDMHLKIA